MTMTFVRRRTRLAIAVAALCASVPAWSIDLSQAYQSAFEQDSTLRAARSAAASRSERVPQARAQLLPNISLSATSFKNSLDETAPNVLGQLSSFQKDYHSSTETLSLRQPIFRKYQFADLDQAKAQVVQANADLEKETQNLAVRVSTAYFEALLTEEQLALVLAQKTAYSTQLDAARKRLSAGAGTRTDIDEALAALDLNRAQELEARQNVDFTRRQLQTITNQPIDTLAGLDTQRLKLQPPTPDSLEEWTSRAEANSPEIQSFKAQLDAARLEVVKARSGHYPTLDAIAQYTKNASDSVNTLNTQYTQKSIGLQLSVPIFAGGYVNSTVRQALAEQDRVEQLLEATRRDLGVRVHREYRGVTEGVLKVQALEQAVRSADQSVISNRRSYEAGSRTLVDTLNAEQQRMSALRDLAQARYVYLLSRVRLLALSGGPHTEVIDEINTWLKH
jgi:outer membrane protein, protease secretion system